MTCSMLHQSADARRVLLEHVHHALGEHRAAGIPVAAVRKPVRREVHVDGHDVLARWSERRILQRRNRDVEIRLARHVPVLRRVERALQVVEARADLNPAAKVAGIRHTTEGRQGAERQIDLGRCAAASVIAQSRVRNTGSRSPASTRSRNVRPGSALETTAAARSSVPFSSPTATARPSATRIRDTGASVRISAPASRAASAIARINVPGPPLTVTLLPPGAGSTAALRSITAPVPADQGPCTVPKIPRAAIAAWSTSVSNHSPTRSATGIGAHRNRRYASVRPSARNRRPVFEQFPHVASPLDIQRRRCALEQWRQEPPQPRQRVAEFGIPLRILRRKSADGFGGPRRVP